MSVRVFVGLLAFAFASTAVCLDLKCYHCMRENQTQGGADDFCHVPSPSQPGNNTVKNCTEQLCAITKSVDKNGLVIGFSRRCLHNGTCALFEGCKGSRDGSVMCVSCCDTNLCNKDDAPIIASTTLVPGSTTLGLNPNSTAGTTPVPTPVTTPVTTPVPTTGTTPVTTPVPTSGAQAHCTSLFLIIFAVFFALV